METQENHVTLLLEHLAQRAEQVGAPQKPYYHQKQPISHQGRYDHQQPIDHDQRYYCHKPVLKDHGSCYYQYQPNVHKVEYYQEPVAHQVTYDHVVPQMRRAGAVLDCNEAAKRYNGVVIKEPQRPQLPQTRRADAVMDCNEAAKRFNGVVIKEFGKKK